MSLQTSSIKDLRIERPAESRSPLRVWMLAFVLLLLCGGAVSAWWFTRPKVLEVRTAVVTEASGKAMTGNGTVLNASGYVTARRQATVSSKITGKVMDVLIEEGMQVREGQVLAHLDSVNVIASLSLAEAQLTATITSLEETRVRAREAARIWERETDLMTKKVNTQADFDRAEAGALALKAKLLQQEAEVAVTRLTVASWKQQLEDTIIRAPFSGIVTSKNAQPGEMISPMSSGGFTRTGICTIVDMESLEIEIDVNESYINRVKPGQAVEATLDAYPDWKIPCKVIAIIPTADRQKSTVKVRVGFEKIDPRILPEMSVKVSFHEAGGAAPAAVKGTLLPAAAVSQENDRDVVYVVRDGRAERRAVTVASRSGDQVVLSAGTSPGELVLLDKPAGLSDGVAVKQLGSPK
jgi:HlyD family secretion protein